MLYEIGQVHIIWKINVLLVFGETKMLKLAEYGTSFV